MPTKLSTYAKVDCTLYRTPIVNFDSVKDTIDKALVNMWQNGYQAANVVEQLLQNEDVVKSMSGELEKALKFQRAQMLSGVEERTAEQIMGNHYQYEQTEAEISARFSTVQGEIADKRKKAEINLGVKREEYSAADRRLEETKDEIRARLDTIGGKEGFKRLMGIYKTVQDVGENKDISTISKDKKSGGLEKKLIDKDKTVDPLGKQATDLDVENALNIVEKKKTDNYGYNSNPKKIWYKSVWSFLNTDIGELFKK